MSKWTAAQPEQKEKHFIVTKLIRADNQTITGCVLEAVINRHTYEIDWHNLEDSQNWKAGWV
jgi:tryptophan-rich hypothetical protein